MFKVTTSCFRR